jgi:hypothetical protein
MVILLNEDVNKRNTAVPLIFKIFEGEVPVLRMGLLLLPEVLGLNTSLIQEFCLLWLKASVQVRNYPVILVGLFRTT